MAPMLSFTRRRVLAWSLAVLCAAASLSTVTATAATTALIMGASGISDPRTYPAYMPNVERYYLSPTVSPGSSCAVGTCTLVPVITPEGLLPPLLGDMRFDPSVARGVVDLESALQTQLTAHPDDDVVVFGYSQSADISTLVKSRLTADPGQVSFVLVGNTNRPNGGLFTRFPGLHIPLLDITFNPPPTPTDTGYATTDIAFQYDPIVDYPRYPLNVVAVLNALAGLPALHLSYPNPYLPPSRGISIFPKELPGGYTLDQLQQLMNDPAHRQTYGDTTYITVPANNLPLLQPLIDFGAATGLGALTTPIVDLIQPALRVVVELGYDRTIPYGVPTRAGLFPAVDPAAVLADLAAAVAEGVRAAVTDIRTHATSPTTSVAAKLAGPSASAAPQTRPVRPRASRALPAAASPKAVHARSQPVDRRSRA